MPFSVKIVSPSGPGVTWPTDSPTYDPAIVLPANRATCSPLGMSSARQAPIVWPLADTRKLAALDVVTLNFPSAFVNRDFLHRGQVDERQGHLAGIVLGRNAAENQWPRSGAAHRRDGRAAA